MHLYSRRHKGGSHLSFVVLLGILGVGLSGASIAWACAPGSYGWDKPQAPASEAPSPNQGASQAPAPPSGGSGPSATQAPPSGGPQGGTVNSPSSAPVKSPSSAPVQSPGRLPVRSPDRQPTAQAPSGIAPQAPSGIAPEVDTSGSVAADSGSSASDSGAASAAPQSRESNSRGEGKGKGSAGTPAQSPGVQSANADLWSAFEADKTSSLTAGADAVAADTGPGTGFAVGLALAGLGAVALFGGLAFAGARRRRSVASNRPGQ